MDDVFKNLLGTQMGLCCIHVLHWMAMLNIELLNSAVFQSLLCLSVFWSNDFYLSLLTVPEASASFSSVCVSVWVSGWLLMFPNCSGILIALLWALWLTVWEKGSCSYSEIQVEVAHTVMSRVHWVYFISLKSISWWCFSFFFFLSLFFLPPLFSSFSSSVRL